MKTILLVAASMSVGAAWADSSMFIYPNANQSPEQQQADEAACQQWSTQQTGFNPASPPPPPQPPAQRQARRGGVARGALRGAALGEVIDDDWETGAKAGALIGGMRRNDQRRDQQAQAQSQQQAYEEQLRTLRERFDRAFATCLKARDYTVG